MNITSRLILLASIISEITYYALIIYLSSFDVKQYLDFEN